jgi:uncharacterized protein (TIGR03118 family)
MKFYSSIQKAIDSQGDNVDTSSKKRCSSPNQSGALFERLEDRRMLSAAPTFKVANLVSSGSASASFTDANLKNPWGISFNPSANVVWVADNGSAVSTVYNPDGSVADTGFYTSINIPAPAGASGVSKPTGQIFNSTSAFTVTEDGKSGAADYVWATENGTIAAWNPNVNPTNAITEVNHSSSGADFTGLAQDSVHGTQYLYAADIHNGTVDVFDANFHAVTFKNAFKDPSIPKGFVPWNVQTVNGEIAVSYVKANSTGTFATKGKGTGILDLFSVKGVLEEQLARGGNLDAPWAVTVAPKTWGSLAGDILVGNFGDGRILAYGTSAKTHTGVFAGFLNHASDNAPIQLPGLWGLTFGDSTDDDSTLFFADGPTTTTGIFGSITIKKTPVATVAAPKPAPTMPTNPFY